MMGGERTNVAKAAVPAPKQPAVNLSSAQQSLLAPTYSFLNSPLANPRSTLSDDTRSLWQSGRLQAKLAVSQPDDLYEQEADRVADHVLRMPEQTVQRTCAACSAGETTCPTCKKNEDDKGLVQRKTAALATSSTDSVPDNFLHSIGPGQPLDSATRAFFEPRFGHDFSKVRVHADGQAAESARSINAKAYTFGHNVVFGAGQYASGTTYGQRLLAHELTHVVQQRGQKSEIGLRIQRQDDAETATAVDVVCDALRTQLENSGRVITLYRKFLAGNVTWKEVQSQIQEVGNAAQGVTGAGHALPQVVQDAIAEVESFGLEEIQQGGALFWELLVGDEESFHIQWVTNEIERQQHLNLVLIEAMYKHGCPDFPGTWDGYQEQVLSIGTRGTEAPPTGVGVPLETRTAVAWVRIGEEEVLVLATEVAGSGRLRFVRWIDSDFRDLALKQAEDKQGSIPAVPSTDVNGLPSSVPGSAARR
jgi:hypothetical protein